MSSTHWLLRGLYTGSLDMLKYLCGCSLLQMSHLLNPGGDCGLAGSIVQSALHCEHGTLLRWVCALLVGLLLVLATCGDLDHRSAGHHHCGHRRHRKIISIALGQHCRSIAALNHSSPGRNGETATLRTELPKATERMLAVAILTQATERAAKAQTVATEQFGYEGFVGPFPLVLPVFCSFSAA